MPCQVGSELHLPRKMAGTGQPSGEKMLTQLVTSSLLAMAMVLPFAKATRADTCLDEEGSARKGRYLADAYCEELQRAFTGSSLIVEVSDQGDACKVEGVFACRDAFRTAVE